MQRLTDTLMLKLAFGLMFALLLLVALPVVAQDTVTDDDVNEIAGQLYCPVCENIPLDTCGTPACIQWRGEIRQMLAQGQDAETIIADFVRRFGDRVVGTPQDPTLRALSLVTPWVLAVVALIFGVRVLLRRKGEAAAVTASSAGSSAKDDDYYRARLEADLQARR